MGEIDISKVMERVHVTGECTVIVSGTIIEGIGNKYSDIDVNVICDSLPKYGDIARFGHAYCHKKNMSFCKNINDNVFMTMDYYEESCYHLDVEYWTRAEYDKILTSLEDNYHEVCLHSDYDYSLNRLSRHEMLLLHRNHVGILAQGISANITSSHLYRLCYLQYRGLSNNYWHFKDVVGAIEANQDHLALEQSRRTLVNEIRAHLYLCGITNPTSKWFLTYWDSRYPYGSFDITGKILDQLYFKNMTCVKDYVRRTFDIISELEKMNREYLNSNEYYQSSQILLGMLGTEKEKRMHSGCAMQDHEFEFRKRSFHKHSGYYEIMA